MNSSEDETNQELEQFIQWKQVRAGYNPDLESRIMHSLQKERKNRLHAFPFLLISFLPFGKSSRKNAIFAACMLSGLAVLTLYWFSLQKSSKSEIIPSDLLARVHNAQSTRTKSSPFTFEFFKASEGAGTAIALVQGDTLREGDRIQPLYWSKDTLFVYVYFLNRHASPFLFSQDKYLLAPGAGAHFPSAFELDNSKGAETILFLGFKSGQDKARLNRAIKTQWNRTPGQIDAMLADLRETMPSGFYMHQFHFIKK